MIDDDGYCAYWTDSRPSERYKVPRILSVEIQLEDDALRSTMQRQLFEGTRLQRTFLRQQRLLRKFAQRETDTAVVELPKQWLGEETRARLAARAPVTYHLAQGVRCAVLDLLTSGSLPK